MELTGQEIWVVEYDGTDLSDCNGVFSTYEKALAAVYEDYERCKDVWFDFEEFIMAGLKDGTFFRFRLVYPELNIDEICGCVIYKTYIQ